MWRGIGEWIGMSLGYAAQGRITDRFRRQASSPTKGTKKLYLRRVVGKCTLACLPPLGDCVKAFRYSSLLSSHQTLYVYTIQAQSLM
ncbi:hypothetical protein TS64_23775 [Aneurinibacillus migulanus]|nr:hypothetical protein TS64_23775 [Aneurinibacillus migulanus]